MSQSTSPTCARCGEPITAGARFCMKCGADVSGEQGSVATAMLPAAEERDAQEQVLELLRKATIGEYEIHRELGRGGMATVYLAHDIALDRKVAIKVMSPALVLMGDGMSERFKREARTAANLSHPHIIPIYTVKSSGKTLFFVMKFIPGRSLESIIKELGPMPIPMVRGILQQVGSALGYAHRNGVVHRDVKPANIMIDEEGWAFVTDFGIAKVAENRGLTMTGIAVGTPSYMSPEQCAAKDITGKSDQYSLGVVAYEMLTGRQPFEGDSAMAIMFAHFHEQPKPLTDMRVDCPPAVAAAVMRMLDKAPEQRWPSLEDALGAMGAVPLAHDNPVRQQLVDIVRSKSNRQILESITPPPTSPVPPARTRAAAPETPTTPIPSTRVTAVSITPPSSTLQPGESIQLTASPKGTGGTGVTGRVDWVSSHPAIATVSPTGLVTAVAPGSATVSASYEGIRGVAEITVTRVPVATVLVTPDAPRLTEGETLQLQVSVLDGKGAALADRRVVWGVMPAGVARVSATGLVTADQPGTTVITAECEGVTGGAKLEVQQPAVASIGLTPATRSVAVGDTAAFTPTLTDARGRTLAERPLSWSSSAPAVAAVSPRGIVTGMGPGTAEIVVRCEAKEARATVTVAPVPVGSVTINQPDPVVAGAKLQLQAMVKDGRGAALAGRAVKWSSSSPAVLMVSGAGEATAMAPGSAKVTAECEGKSWTVTVTVKPVPVGSVNLEGAPGPLVPGATATLTAVVKDAGGKVLAGQPVTWASSTTSVATISAAGVVTAKGPGTTTITATAGDRSAEIRLTVVAPVAAEARTEVIRPPAAPPPQPAPVPPAQRAPIVERPAPEPVAEPAAPPAAGGKGKLIGIGVGLAVLAAVAFVVLRPTGTDLPPQPGVAPPGPVQPAPVASVTLSGEATPVPVGRTRQLLAVLKDAGGIELGSRQVHWSSSDPSVAEVSPQGAVTGKSAGSVTITATSEGKSDSFGLVVEEAGRDLPAAVASVSVSGGGRTVDVGATVQLAATVKDDKGNVLSGRTVVWSSEPAEVASVTSSGLVTALAGGTAEIEAGSEGKSATTRITVNQPRPRPEPPAPAPAPVASIAVAPANPGVTVGQTVTLSADLLDAQRNPLSGRALEWSSSDERVASVSHDGVVTGVARGTATITASAEGKSASTRVTVSEATVAVASVSLTPAARSIKVGESTSWTAAARDSRGRDLDDRTVSWSSSAPQIAAVRGNGTITGVAAGTAEIRAEVEGKSASASITVAAAPAPAPPPAPGPAPAGNTALLPRRGVAAGGAFSCGIATGGAVCWGTGYDGLTAIDGTAGITAVTLGKSHGCGLLPGGRAVCWGDNRLGQLGDAGGRNSPTAAVPVAGGLGFSSLSAGNNHTCGIAGTKVWCWGKGREGQLGEGSGSDRKKPVQVRSGENFVAVAAGGNHSCAITAGGKAWCWGDGFAGQLGFGGQDRQTEPVDVSGDLKFIRITAGFKHSCGLTGAGKAWCWGANESGQLGDGSKSDRLKPQAVEGGLGFTEISAGTAHTCGLSGSDIYCWGENQAGQLGDGTKTNRTRPVPVSGGLSFTAVSAGETHSCGMTRGSETVCWGKNDKGQLGDGSTEPRLEPEKVRANR